MVTVQEMATDQVMETDQGMAVVITVVITVVVTVVTMADIMADIIHIMDMEAITEVIGELQCGQVWLSVRSYQYCLIMIAI